MNSFELNKMAGAVLFALLVAIGLSNMAEILYSTPEPNPKAFEIQVADATAGGAAAAPAQDPDVATLLATADIAAGEKVSKKCGACHNLVEGAGAKVGPDLYGVVGRQVASAAGFAYSAGMKDFAGKAEGGKWTFKELYQFVKAPKAFVPGTAMGFGGISDPKQRADLIAYLNSNSESPLPLPKPEAAPAAAPAPAAKDAAPAAAPAK
ncbi:MAG: cytochrome c family protein [Parvibaculaceae bacterium]|nr:cytochrome c family protein [Parvibaculaceae bacterium]